MSLQNKFLSKELSDKFWKEGLTLATAESCTAGNIAAASKEWWLHGHRRA